jgi:hypothetical protein
VSVQKNELPFGDLVEGMGTYPAISSLHQHDVALLTRMVEVDGGLSPSTGLGSNPAEIDDYYDTLNAGRRRRRAMEHVAGRPPPASGFAESVPSVSKNGPGSRVTP